MNIRYQKSQIEDVAVLLHFHHDINVSGPIAIATLAGHFADLFDANNPPVCVRCRTPKTQARQGIGCRYADEHHKWSGGFNRKQFLEACGLKEQS